MAPIRLVADFRADEPQEGTRLSNVLPRAVNRGWSVRAWIGGRIDVVAGGPRLLGGHAPPFGGNPALVLDSKCHAGNCAGCTPAEACAW